MTEGEEGNNSSDNWDHEEAHTFEIFFLANS